MDRKECYKLTNTLSNISGYATAVMLEPDSKSSVGVTLPVMYAAADSCTFSDSCKICLVSVLRIE